MRLGFFLTFLFFPVSSLANVSTPETLPFYEVERKSEVSLGRGVILLVQSCGPNEVFYRGQCRNTDGPRPPAPKGLPEGAQISGGESSGGKTCQPPLVMFFGQCTQVAGTRSTVAFPH